MKARAYLRHNASWLLVPAFFVLLGCVLRITLRSSSALWEDEIIAATHAVQPWWRVIVDSIINDMHPPFYFFELHLWSAFNQSDAWLIANTALLSLLALASMWITMRRLYDDISGAMITTVFAVLPVCLWMAEEVRMYAMLSLMFIWMYYFVMRSFAAAAAKRKYYIGAALLGLAIVYTHAIGFVAVLFFGLYAASWLLARQAGRREWLCWLAIFGGVGVLALPMIAADLLHQADMPPPKNIRDILDWLSSVVVGNGYQLSAGIEGAGLLIYLVTVIAGLRMPETRRATCCFLIGPVVLCLLVAFFARPLFKTDFFSNFYTPFLAITIGMLLAKIFDHRRRNLASGVIFALFLCVAIPDRLAINRTEGYYPKVVATINAERQPGDVVWVPQADIFWGVAWYMIGPHWGSPVSTIAPLRNGSGWHKIFALLGPRWVERLDLLPKKQSVTTSDGTKILMAASSRTDAEAASRLWLVIYAPRNDMPTGLPADQLGPLIRSKSYSFAPLQVNLYVKPSRD